MCPAGSFAAGVMLSMAADIIVAVSLCVQKLRTVRGVNCSGYTTVASLAHCRCGFEPAPPLQPCQLGHATAAVGAHAHKRSRLITTYAGKPRISVANAGPYLILAAAS